jgi:glycyl-tRNA synthetase beta chain
LAVLVHNLQLQQNNQTIERKGPAVTAPEQAVAGFAKSCGVSKEDLTWGGKSFCPIKRQI